MSKRSEQAFLDAFLPAFAAAAERSSRSVEAEKERTAANKARVEQREDEQAFRKEEGAAADKTAMERENFRLIGELAKSGLLSKESLEGFDPILAEGLLKANAEALKQREQEMQQQKDLYAMHAGMKRDYDRASQLQLINEWKDDHSVINDPAWKKSAEIIGLDTSDLPNVVGMVPTIDDPALRNLDPDALVFVKAENKDMKVRDAIDTAKANRKKAQEATLIGRAKGFFSEVKKNFSEETVKTQPKIQSSEPTSENPFGVYFYPTR